MNKDDMPALEEIPVPITDQLKGMKNKRIGILIEPFCPVGCPRVCLVKCAIDCDCVCPNHLFEQLDLNALKECSDTISIRDLYTLAAPHNYSSLLPERIQNCQKIFNTSEEEAKVALQKRDDDWHSLKECFDIEAMTEKMSDIELVMSQTGKSKLESKAALEKCNNDIVDAILLLTM